MQGEVEELKHINKTLYVTVGLLIALIVSAYLWNIRGGMFMVKACRNDDSNKCYTLRAYLSAEWRYPEGTLLFSNGGSLHFTCSEDFGCEDVDSNYWNIDKLYRL